VGGGVGGVGESAGGHEGGLVLRRRRPAAGHLRSRDHVRSRHGAVRLTGEGGLQPNLEEDQGTEKVPGDPCTHCGKFQVFPVLIRSLNLEA